MKYNITYSCGHDGVVDLIGKRADRERKLAFLKERGLCPDCRRKAKEEERKRMGGWLTAEPEAIRGATEVMAVILACGNTFDEEVLKKLDLSWNGANWQKTVPFSSLKAEIALAAENGVESRINIEEMKASASYYYASQSAATWQEAKEALASLEEPAVPELITGRHWNKKVYGKAGSLAIYLDNEKIPVTDEQAAELDQYLKDAERFQIQKEIIIARAEGRKDDVYDLREKFATL